MKIFINPGHAPNGYPDPGATGFLLRESDVAENVGSLACKYLNAAGVETEIMQSDSLTDIVNTANNSGADLFMSIHCNAFNGTAKGTETCVYSSSSEGANFGQYVQKQIVNTFGTIDRGLKERPNLYVLNHTSMPAILVELAFIDNAEDNALLRNRQDDFARALARGVTDYLSVASIDMSQTQEQVSSEGLFAKYFSRDEFACHCCGELPENGINPRLQSLLDSMRERVGGPLVISCAYRCPSHNAEVGGVPDSQHVLGNAADVQLPAGWSVEALHALAEECGADGIGDYEWGCHVDVRGYWARW